MCAAGVLLLSGPAIQVCQRLVEPGRVVRLVRKRSLPHFEDERRPVALGVGHRVPVTPVVRDPVAVIPHLTSLERYDSPRGSCALPRECLSVDIR